MNKREYRHPQIDHTFIIEDISIDEISIDGIRIHKKDLDWMMMLQQGDSNMNDFALPILQNVISSTVTTINNEGLIF